MPADEERIESWLRSRGFVPSRKLVTTIPIRRYTPEDPPYETLAGVEQFQHWAEHSAYLQLGEYPYQAWLASILGFYPAQIDNGGHDQWIANLRFDELRIDATGFGLELLGLSDYHAIWRRYVDYSRPANKRSALRERWGFGPRDKDSQKVDEDFFRIGSTRLVEATVDWLRAEGVLRVMTPAELEAEEARIIQLNEAWADRKAQAERDREGRDPLAAIVRRLCKTAGANPESPLLGGERPIVKHAGRSISQLIWFVKSDRGLLLIVVTPPQLLAPAMAHLGRHQTGKDPVMLTKTRLGKAEYEAIVDYFALGSG